MPLPRYKMRAVVRKYHGPWNGGKLIGGREPVHVPMEELECGHVKPDNDERYGDERAVQIKALAKEFHGKLGKRRCYDCGKVA